MSEPPVPERFKRATAHAETFSTWWGCGGAAVAIVSALYQGLGVTLALLAALAAFPLAFLTSLLIRTRRDLAESIIGFLRAHSPGLDQPKSEASHPPASKALARPLSPEAEATLEPTAADQA